MAILAYGINHRTAPIELRERLAFPEETLGSALTELLKCVPGLSEASIVSTCNRTEFFCSIDPAEEPTLQRWFADHRHVPMHQLASVTYSYWDQDAARHLIRVAAGLDSQVLGEPQIMGQVKSAFDLARNLGAIGPELNLLHKVALNTAKRVRTDTDIGRNPVSVAYAAVTMARQIFADLSRKSALLLGAGDTIQRVAEHLTEAGIGRLAIANRTLANAEALAARFGARPMQLTEAPAHLHEFDVVISSTGAALPIIGKGAVEAAIRQRRHRPMFMVDIAVPRDIEPEVAELADVFLYSIDDLSELIDANLRERKTAAESAEELVAEGARRYVRERRAHQGQQLLRQFRDQAQVIQATELQKALRAIEAGGDPAVVLAELSQSLTNKLIHAPTVAIRNASSDGRADLLEVLKSLYSLD